MKNRLNVMFVIRNLGRKEVYKIIEEFIQVKNRLNVMFVMNKFTQQGTLRNHLRIHFGENS